MKRLLIILGIMLGAVLMFILGLFPAERILMSDHSAPSESYILIGTGRFAVFITALCEFTIGCLVAALWVKWTKKKKTEQGPSPYAKPEAAE